MNIMVAFIREPYAGKLPLYVRVTLSFEVRPYEENICYQVMLNIWGIRHASRVYAEGFFDYLTCKQHICYMADMNMYTCLINEY